MLTQQKIQELCFYFDGNLYWRKSRSGAQTNKRVGAIETDGRIRALIFGKRYRMHRLIYLYHYGYMPTYIDHIDGNVTNNSIENLRECTNQQNQYNSKLNIKNTSGHKNVHFNKRINKWSVYLRINKNKTYFGVYDDLELAALVATEARDKFHNNFARHF